MGINRFVYWASNLDRMVQEKDDIRPETGQMTRNEPSGEYEEEHSKHRERHEQEKLGCKETEGKPVCMTCSEQVRESHEGQDGRIALCCLCK